MSEQLLPTPHSAWKHTTVPLSLPILICNRNTSAGCDCDASDPNNGTNLTTPNHTLNKSHQGEQSQRGDRATRAMPK